MILDMAMAEGSSRTSQATPAWRLRSLALATALCLAPLAACHDNISAATADNAQVCYSFSTTTPVKKVLVSPGDENLETCAMHLEGWRLMHKLPAVTGSYQGHYVFASVQDITSSTGPKDIRYRVYTPGQHADLDQKLQTLIERTPPAPDGQNTLDNQNTQGDTQK